MTGRVSPSSGISMYGLSAIEVFHLNCVAAVPTVFCVCNAWLWGQLSFSDARSITWEVVGSVNSCGRRCFLNVIENVVPRWFCRVSRYIFQRIFGCDGPFLGQQSSLSDRV